jgi:hypothetical protein
VRRMNVLWSLMLISLLGLTGLTGQAYATGWVITMQTAKGPTILYLDETLGAKMSMQTQSEMYMISRADQQRLYQVNATKGTYMVMSWDKVRYHRKMATMPMQERLKRLPPEQRTAMEQRLAKLRQQMQHMPPEQRARFEKMLQQHTGTETTPEPDKITYQKTGREQTINGFKTWQVIKYKNGQKDQELWVAAVEDWQRIGSTWKNALQALQGDKDDFSFEEAGGLPIRMIDGQNITELRSITERSFASSDFSPPQGARQISLQEMMRSGQR